MSNYRRINKINFTTWSTTEKKMFWNENTGEFEQKIVDVQDEIDKYKGLDLKSLMEKNLTTTIDKSPVYIDETAFKDVHLSSVYDGLNTQIVEEGNYMEQMAVAQEIENKVIEQNSQPDNSQIKEDNYINIKVNKLTGEVIK